MHPSLSTLAQRHKKNMRESAVNERTLWGVVCQPMASCEVGDMTFFIWNRLDRGLIDVFSSKLPMLISQF